MEVSGRANEPWDALFVFHFLCWERDHVVADSLQRLIAREAGAGLNFSAEMTADNKDTRCRVLGRFLERKECVGLISAWNEPDCDMDYMCYEPNHGIATVTDGKLDWWALICFQCANAGIHGPLMLSENSVPTRRLPEGPRLQEKLIGLLPERPFSIRG